MSPRHTRRRNGGLASGTRAAPGARRPARLLAGLLVLAGGPTAVRAAGGDGAPPATAAGQAADAGRRVLVVPFSGLSDTNAAVVAASQGLMNELSARGFKAERSNEGVGNDERPDAAAARLSKAAGVRYVVTGSAYVVGQSTRLEGQVYDAQSGKPAALVKATGPTDRFFDTQDDFVRQTVAAVGGGSRPDTTASGGRPGPEATPPAGASAYAADSAVPAPSPAVGSHWAGYEAYDQAARSAQPVMMQAPSPPQQPMGGNGYGNGLAPYGYPGYGAFGEYGVSGPFPGGVVGGSGRNQLGIGRGLVPGQLGISNAPPPGSVTGVPTVAAGSFLPQIPRATQIPPYNHPVQDYKSPFLPSPVGQPQRVTAPPLRPGAASPARPTG